MSLETVSRKRDRVYFRHFDHDEAKTLREADPETWTYKRLAEHFGVSVQGMRRVLDPKTRAMMDEKSRLYLWEHNRVPCASGCGQLVWKWKGRTGYCTTCSSERRATSVRPSELRCGRCRQWKPDEAFPHAKGNKTRRKRHSLCRPCNTIQRREHRERNPHMQREADQRQYAKRRDKHMARFIVFQPNGAGYVELERVDAGSPAHAIEKVAKLPGEYIAVPEGRFKIMRVAPVQALKVVPDSTVESTVA